MPEALKWSFAIKPFSLLLNQPADSDTRTMYLSFHGLLSSLSISQSHQNSSMHLSKLPKVRLHSFSHSSDQLSALWSLKNSFHLLWSSLIQTTVSSTASSTRLPIVNTSPSFIARCFFFVVSPSGLHCCWEFCLLGSKDAAHFSVSRSETTEKNQGKLTVL